MIENGWLRDDYEEEEIVKYYCDECGEPIYEGDYYYTFGGDKVCEQCIEKMQKIA